MRNSFGFPVATGVADVIGTQVVKFPTGSWVETWMLPPQPVSMLVLSVDARGGRLKVTKTAALRAIRFVPAGSFAGEDETTCRKSLTTKLLGSGALPGLEGAKATPSESCR